jgi:hypothetical protein
MSQRKPMGMQWESWIDRQIREARDRGEFDDLPGHGKPIDGLDQPRDELWWVRQMIQRESLSVTPPTLAVRKALDEAKAAIAEQSSEDAVRKIVADINAKIRHVNRTATIGPPSTLMPLDVEDVVRKWQERSA